MSGRDRVRGSERSHHRNGDSVLHPTRRASRIDRHGNGHRIGTVCLLDVLVSCFGGWSDSSVGRVLASHTQGSLEWFKNCPSLRNHGETLKHNFQINSNSLREKIEKEGGSLYIYTIVNVNIHAISPTVELGNGKEKIAHSLQ